jgi:hypothetical protein
MTYSGRSLPQVTPFGVSAHFVDQPAANAATRALQKKLGIPTEAIGVAIEPGPDPAEVAGRDGYMGLTKGGHVIVNVSVPDAEIAERVRAVLAAAGGELTSEEQRGSPSVGAYGPTTAHGRVGIIGGPPETSSMAEKSYQDTLEQEERERREGERRSS